MRKSQPAKIVLTYNTPSQEAIERFTENVMMWYNNQTQAIQIKDEPEETVA